MQRTNFGDMTCSIARTLHVAGEPWSPLILRDIWVGIRRFEDLQNDLGISSKVLAQRLRWLTEHEIIQQRPYGERPIRREYALTVKGQELCAVLMAITAWGDRWAATPEGPPVLLRHAACGAVTSAEVRCANCGEALHADEVVVEPGPGA